MPSLPLPEPEPSPGQNGEERLWSTEFVAAIAVACLSIGLLLGILIMCLYRKYCEGDHRQPVVERIPGCEYRCYPVPHDQGRANPGYSNPVFMLPDPCRCDNHLVSNPPSYLSNATPNHRRGQEAPPTTPNMSQHRLSVSTQDILLGQRARGSLTHSQLDLDPSRITSSNSQSCPPNGANGRRTHHDLTAASNDSPNRHTLCVSDNSSGQRTPRSMTSSNSDLDPAPVLGCRNITPGCAQMLSPIASVCDGGSPSMSRHIPQDSRNLQIDGGGDQRTRRNDEEELISMKELTHDVNEPQALLQNAPVLDPSSILGRLNDGLPRHRSSSDEEIALPIIVESINEHSNALPCPSPRNVEGEVELVHKRNNLEKEQVEKWIPSKQLPFGSYLGLPHRPRIGFEEECCHEIEDLKLFNRCPEDIRIIFQPIEASKMITVREKKIVYMCRRLDSQGGVLRLDHMGISLVVPPEAIPRGQSSLVTLVLNWDLSDNPPMDRREALVSPVVYCGPHASKFEKPCRLMFKHCAYDNRYAQIMTSETDLFDDKSWDDFGTNDNSDGGDTTQRKSLDSPSRSNVSITVDECQVEVSHFSLYTCILRSKYLHMKKWLQVAVFTHNMSQCLHHQTIRVYFLNKTPCALQWAIQNEASYGFRMAGPETVFLFEERGEDLLVRLSYLSDGWEMVSQDGQSTTAGVQFEQIWHGACPHVCLCFKRSVTPGDGHNAVPNALAQPDDSSDGGSEAGDRLQTPAVNEAVVTREVTQTHANEESGASSSEIIVRLKLSQTRSENMSSNIYILMHDFETIGVHIPDEEDTHLKTIG